jgi:hypothetical protein
MQTPVTVTGWPGVTTGGTLVLADMSARGATLTVVLAVLFGVTGSVALVPLVAVTVTVPLGGAVKLTAQLMAEPTASGSDTGFGVQFTVAPDGRPAVGTVQVGAVAGLGPLLVQVTAPLTALPGSGLVGKAVIATAMSAWTATLIGVLAGLFVATGSGVLLAAVAEIVTEPLAGAVKLTAQLIDAPTASGLGAGAGVQFTVAPAGRPAVGTLQVGDAAGSGPLLVQATVPVTVLPGCGLLGKPLMATAMSADNDGSTRR